MINNNIEMNDRIPNDNKTATAYLLNWMKTVKEERANNPEAFINTKSGIYIGGLKLMPADSIVTDNHGLPHIIRAGCCE